VPAAATDVPSAADLPLDGITVLELGVQFAAPYAATVLTDLGARVIKIESLEGDIIRTMMPFPEAAGAKVMQGKESICVDISTDEGAAIVRDIAARADILLNGFRPGAADRHGLSADELQKLNPRLVYVTASGYGDGGPDSVRPAFAPSIGAASGIGRANLGNSVAERTGLTPTEIRDCSVRLFAGTAIVQAQADGFAALSLATSMLLGLLARERSGEGPKVSSSMLATATHAMAEHVVDIVGVPPAPGPGEDMRGPNARYRIYDAADGWVFLAAPSESDWNGLTVALRPYVDLGADDRFVTAELRSVNDDALVEVLSGVFAKQTKAEWERELLGADVACVAVSTDRIERFLQDEDTGKAAGYVTEVTHPTFDRHLRLAPLVRFSRSKTQAMPGVLAGQSTELVLGELGYDEARIADLRERKIVR
jgi:crotonobetainyl-CoA:carnitine CoA-transferase CaiB-like acyl-CoA transferase